ncbi:MAG: hypothetical protein IKZ66_03595, partial [Schwartzia sp.]|nr:hypothetical protein [Schwartzia sp. (in: firmicutes)]
MRNGARWRKNRRKEAEGVEELTGVVDSVVFDSGDGRFSVFRLIPDGQPGRVSVTIASAAPLVGQELSLQGEWVEHPRFGSQFQAAHIRVAAPTSTQGILRFLASGAVQGVGPAMAQRIVARFGAETLDVIENAPSRLREVSGIGKKTAQKIYCFGTQIGKRCTSRTLDTLRQLDSAMVEKAVIIVL